MSVLIAVWRSYCKLRRTWVKQQTSLRINSSDGRTDERTNGKPMDLWPRRYPPRCKWTVSIDREASIIPPSFSNRSIKIMESWNSSKLNITHWLTTGSSNIRFLRTLVHPFPFSKFSLDTLDLARNTVNRAKIETLRVLIEAEIPIRAVTGK